MSVQNSSLIPLINEYDILGRLTKSPEDKAILQNGLKYLEGEETVGWLENRKGDLEKIVAIARSSMEAHKKSQQLRQEIECANYVLGSIAGKQQSIDEKSKAANETFMKSSEGLQGRLREVQQKIQSENKIALLTFTNPLATKVGQMAAKIGQHTFSVAVPLVGIFHREALTENCAQVFSRSISATMECASTFGQKTVYIPLAIAAGVTYACSCAYSIGKRILKNQARAITLESEIRKTEIDYREVTEDFSIQKETLAKEHAANRSTIEAALKEQTALDATKDRLDGIFVKIRQNILADLSERNLSLLKNVVPTLPDIARQQVGASCMQNIMDAMVAAYADVAQSQRAIGTAPAQAQIQE